jgi:hypothetical protein
MDSKRPCVAMGPNESLSLLLELLFSLIITTIVAGHI